MRAMNERDADCTGPTNVDSARPKTQNSPLPSTKSTASPESDRMMSDTTMTSLGPNRSSAHPPTKVPAPAATFAAIAKRMTSVALKPNTDEAMMAPKVKTPDRPSRNTADAARKSSVFGAVRPMRAIVRNRMRYDSTMPTRVGTTPVGGSSGTLSSSGSAKTRNQKALASTARRTSSEPPSRPVGMPSTPLPSPPSGKMKSTSSSASSTMPPT